MKNHVALAALLLCVSSHAHAQVDGILGLQPVGAVAYVSVEVSVAGGESLAGLTWYHNDESTTFPRILLMEGQPNTPPDLGQTALILLEITGESLGWGDVTLATPVSSTTGSIDVVFEFPPNGEMTGEGYGGGPGIGYSIAPGGLATHLSADGVEWARLHGGFAMAINPDLVLPKAAPVMLSSLKGQETQKPKPFSVPRYRTTLGQPVPNPFNPRTEISFSLATPGAARLAIFNLRGQRIVTLVDEFLNAGDHQFSWLGTDDRGQPVASGVYFAQLNHAGDSLVRRMALVR